MSKLPIIAALLFTLNGCATWTTPSTYSNHSTPNGNVVTAQGQAASNAAYANTSHNCPSCVASTVNGRQGYYDQFGRFHPGVARLSEEEQLAADIKHDLYDTLRYAISSYTWKALYH